MALAKLLAKVVMGSILDFRSAWPSSVAEVRITHNVPKHRLASQNVFFGKNGCIKWMVVEDAKRRSGLDL